MAMVHAGPEELSSANSRAEPCGRASHDVRSVLTILVGTVTGTAALVAEEVERVLLNKYDVDVSIRRMDGLTAEVLAAGGLFLICSSTYGKGNVPDNAAHLYANLRTVEPDLSNVSYGVIGLGDRRYPRTFANGAKRFDEILTTLGARRIGGVLSHDAGSGIPAEEAAAEWIEQWVVEVMRSSDLVITGRYPGRHE